MRLGSLGSTRESQERRCHAASGALTVAGRSAAGTPTLLSRGSLDDLPAWAAELLEQGRVAHLGLLDEAGGPPVPAGAPPRARPVTSARVAPSLWSAIDDTPKRRPGELPARVRRLRADPRVALTVDRYAEDWTRLAWVQVLGEIAVLDAGEEALRALAARYAPYRERPPRGPLLRLDPVRVLWWRA